MYVCTYIHKHIHAHINYDRANLGVLDGHAEDLHVGGDPITIIGGDLSIVGGDPFTIVGNTM